MMSACSQNDGDWIPLFDGSTLQGWHSYGKSVPGAAWTVQDSAIHLVPNRLTGGYQTNDGGDLVTEMEFEDFELKLEWKIAKNGNSGIIFYVQEDPALYPETWFTGIETQVLDITGNEDANSPKHQIADLYDLVAATSHPGKPFGEWNKVRIKSQHGKLDIWLNDTRVIETTLWDQQWKELSAKSKFHEMPDFGMFKKGRIALQDHGDEVWYRNIMIRKL